MDFGGNDGEVYTVKGLKLYSVDKRIWEARNRAALASADAHDTDIAETTSQLGGTHERNVKIGGGLPAAA